MTDQVGERDFVHVEREYQTSAADLWEAITSPARLARWVVQVSGDLRPGGSFAAEFTSGWSGPGIVTACEPPHRLVVRMAPDSDESTTIEATISAADQGVRLVVEERGNAIEDVPAHVAGWRIHLEDLAIDLSGATPPPWEPRWRAELAAAAPR